MSQKMVSAGEVMSSFKWFLVFTLIAAGVAGNYYYSDHSFLLRLVAFLLLGGAAGFLALQTDSGHKLSRFASGAKTELRKVVWPSRRETGQTTLIVIVMVSVVGVTLWGIDALLLRVIAWITGYGAV
jgi:preprotein translocase subunit SecE